MEQVSIARAIAVVAHRWQKYGGRDYFNAHVKPVAELVMAMSMGDEDSIAAAYLHDVLEDTDLTWAGLMKAGVSNRVANIVVELTKREGEIYRDYIKRVKSGSIEARRIKLADLTVNIAGKHESLAKRYEWAINYLKGSYEQV